VILFLANQDTPKDTFRANLIGYFFLLNWLALGLFIFSGLLTWRVFTDTTIFVPAMLLGTLFGILLSRRFPDVLFRKLVMLAVAIIGVVLLIQSVPSLL
jgi:uncharacterized membrane protein YfcA